MNGTDEGARHRGVHGFQARLRRPGVDSIDPGMTSVVPRNDRSARIDERRPVIPAELLRGPEPMNGTDEGLRDRRDHGFRARLRRPGVDSVDPGMTSVVPGM